MSGVAKDLSAAATPLHNSTNTTGTNISIASSISNRRGSVSTPSKRLSAAVVAAPSADDVRKTFGQETAAPPQQLTATTNASTDRPVSAGAENDVTISSFDAIAMPAARRPPLEVGLGLMLDQSSVTSARTSFEVDSAAQLPTSPPLLSTPAPNASSHVSVKPSTSTGGKAAADVRQLLSELGIDDDVSAAHSVEERPRPSSTPSPTNRAAGPPGWNNSAASSGSNSPPGTSASAMSSLLTRRGDTLPRLSTVTTSSGSTSSPLMIFTGSPNPQTTPRSFSPSCSSRTSVSPTPSPTAHSAYVVPVTARTPTASASASGTSGPMARVGSAVASAAMDRNASGSKSRTSDVHSRHQSLTSACAPVTSSYTSTTPDLGSGLLATLSPANGALSSASAYPASPTTSQRGWKVYDWGSGSSKEKDVFSSPTRTNDENPRKGAKGAPGHPSRTEQLVALPSTLLGLFLAPLYGSPRDHAHYSPTLNASTMPTAKAKRQPLLLRTLLLAYLVFSTVFFGLHLASVITGRPSQPPKRLGPRGDEVRGLQVPLGSRELPLAGAGKFVLGKVGAEWAQKVAEGVRWGKMAIVPAPNVPLDAMADISPESSPFYTVRRVGSGAIANRRPEDNPLTLLTHTYRFAKMHEKIHMDQHDEIVPYAFRATGVPNTQDVTAALYSNEAWLSVLPAFVEAWNGPVSLVFETAHSRTSSLRSDLMKKLAALRQSNDLVRKYVDIHIIGAPVGTSEHMLNRCRERMIERPLARNFHLNLGRFFASTEMVFLVGDARITPSPGLNRRLNGATVRDLVLSRGDAVVVASFAFVRDPYNDPKTFNRPSLHQLRAQLGLPASSKWAGVAHEEFDALAAEHIQMLESTLPLARAEWPTKKASLVTLVNTRSGSPSNPTTARMALFDRRWDPNHGPTNWYLWRKSATDARLLEKPESGGGVGLGVGGRVGGGNDVYRVLDYDLHFAPFVVVSKKGQPWCTERFEEMPAACVYQMYLAGAEMWVLPDEWVFTKEMIEKRADSQNEDPAEKLKNSISSRLYGKFHQEACMHYGREFLSLSMWDSEKAQNCRKTCARTDAFCYLALLLV
ncbi:BQ5605_C033g11136 [Microbotryum silenes-dioicae]|uniref:BQ5605_C033g11136 protein n=1 Tax=Microbotryum silenes-dioicae TaxID=796604 RepID=A0A2X0MJI3_9BASI|nr:BQ5605_C033g11136 [Microbotryum silenes-dioicae]